MNNMQRGALESNAESDRLAHARVLGEAAGKLLAALNSLPTEDDVRRIVREELTRQATVPKLCHSDTRECRLNPRCEYVCNLPAPLSDT